LGLTSTAGEEGRAARGGSGKKQAAQAKTNAPAYAEGKEYSLYPEVNVPPETRLDSHAWLEKMDAWLEEKPTLAFSYRYEGHDVHEGKWTEIGISDGKETFFLARGAQAAIVIDRLHEVLADDGVRKLMADSKSLHSLLMNEGISLAGIDLDLSLAAYLLNPNRSNYSAAELLRDFAPDLFSLSASDEAYLLYHLAEGYKENLAKEKLDKLLHEVEEPLSKVLACMEKTGIKVDEALLREFGQELDEKIRCSTKICAWPAAALILIRLSSGKVLFEDSAAAAEKDNDRLFHDAETLEELRGEHPIIEKILEYRQLVKLNSTYVKGLLAQVYEGKIHTTFQQTVTATGRLSSTEPNLQNIPIRSEEARKLRKVFCPGEKNWLLFSATILK
jgi:DNA polymerase-1